MISLYGKLDYMRQEDTVKIDNETFFMIHFIKQLVHEQRMYSYSSLSKIFVSISRLGRVVFS